MVGVPGRSKACHPCKKRRVACDLQRPKCLRCVKAERDCAYAENAIFVLNDEGTHKTKYKRTDGLQATLDRSDHIKPSKQKQIRPLNLETSDHLSNVINQALLLCKPPSDGHLSQQALLSHALDGETVYKTTTLATLAFSIVGGLRSTSLCTPFLACYTSWLGRRENNSRLVDASRELYVHALKETHNALIGPETAYADSTLGACNALSIYEALECPDENMNAYHWHRAASYRIVQMRGPVIHQDGPAHRIFTNFRFFGILHAFDNGQDTYLSSPEWTEIPFAIHAKSKFDELIDIFALGPEVAWMGKTVPFLPKDEVLPMAISILDKLVIINQKLQSFYNRLEEDWGRDIYWIRISPIRNDAVVTGTQDSELIFPPALCFRDLDTATIMTLYWAIVVMAWSGLGDLYSLFNEHGVTHIFKTAMADQGELSSEAVQALWLNAARKVLQSVAYCTSNEALQTGPPRGMTQLAIVTDVMKRQQGCKVEYSWAVKALKTLGTKWLRILKFGI